MVKNHLLNLYAIESYNPLITSCLYCDKAYQSRQVLLYNVIVYEILLIDLLIIDHTPATIGIPGTDTLLTITGKLTTVLLLEHSHNLHPENKIYT